jgi:hypothetical protein
MAAIYGTLVFAYKGIRPLSILEFFTMILMVIFFILQDYFAKKTGYD